MGETLGRAGASVPRLLLPPSGRHSARPSPCRVSGAGTNHAATPNGRIGHSLSSAVPQRAPAYSCAIHGHADAATPPLARNQVPGDVAWASPTSANGDTRVSHCPIMLSKFISRYYELASGGPTAVPSVAGRGHGDGRVAVRAQQFRHPARNPWSTRGAGLTEPRHPSSPGRNCQREFPARIVRWSARADSLGPPGRSTESRETRA